MNKLSKSTITLLILAAAAIILGVILFLNIPAPLSEALEAVKSGAFLEDGFNFHGRMYQDGGIGARRAPGFGGTYGRMPHFPVFGIIFLILVIGFIARKGSFAQRTNHGRAILDVMYAEEKINEKEYRRKRTVIEEE